LASSFGGESDWLNSDATDNIGVWLSTRYRNSIIGRVRQAPGWLLESEDGEFEVGLGPIFCT